MKKIILAFLVLYTFGNYSYSQQTVYSENFNAGFGGWANTDLVAPWGNTTDGFGLTNIWQNSDAESGMGTNNCGVANAGNPTLYMGADGMVSGAAYSSTANTNRRIASPNISTVGYSNMTMGFKFIGNGCETRDRAYFQYSIDGGTNWVSPTAAPTSSNPAMGTGGNMGNLKSTICTGGQGRWTEITWDLPASCENIADLKIAFVWQNSDGATCSGTPTDPSFAVDDIIIIMPTSVTPPVADFSASKTSICAGECVDFTDLSTNSPTSWAWTFTGAATTSSNIQNPTSICYNTPGQYTVELIATNAGGSDTETKTNYITVHALPTVNLGPDTTLCSGDILVLDAGAGFSDYVWTPSGATQTINVTTSGAYSVTVTDANTCQGSDAILVNVVNQADATILSSGSYCLNATSFNLTATDPGGTWSGPGITNPSAGTFDPGTAGVGVHTIYYEIFGLCGDIDSVNITVHALPTVNLGPDTTLCSGDILVLDAGAGFSGYAWTPSGTTQAINVTSSGTYSVTVTDANTCQGSDAIVVTVINQADATILSSGSYCLNVASFNLTATDPGGTWSGPGIINAAAGTFDPGTAGVGVHTIYYEIFGLCGDIDSVKITVHALPTVNLGPDTTICSGDILVLDAGAGYTYNWSPSGSNQTFNVTSSGTYSVTVTDGNTCQDTDAITVTVIDQQDATITTAGPFCDNNSPVQLQAVDGGGSWTGTVGLSNSGMFDPSAAGTGTHTITHTIAGACGDTDTRDIIVNEAPMVSITHNDESCIGADDGGAVIVIIDGTSPYSINWKPGGENSDSLIGLAPGTYEVLVIDQKGCRDSVDVIILAGTDDCLPPHVYVPNVFSPNGDGQNDILFVRGEGFQYLEFIIYNRWGEKLFETTSKDVGWDGTYKGQRCDPGVYVYHIKITFTNGTAYNNKGNTTLVH